MSDSEPVKTPEFSVPLTKEDLAQLGQFNAIWSQVDFLVTVLIGKLANTDMENVLTMTGSATAAPRIAMLKRLAEKAKDAELVAVCKGMGKLIGSRNHLSHGVWGWYWGADGSRKVGCQYHLVSGKPIFASDLSMLTLTVTGASHDLGNAMRRIMPELDRGDRPQQFLFGPGDDPNNDPGPGYTKIRTGPVGT